jgi:hypothetical protein
MKINKWGKLLKESKEKLILEQELKWGFDLTDMPAKNWKIILSSLGINQSKGININDRWLWKGTGIKIFTGNDPITGKYGSLGSREDDIGYASYIGIEGDADKVNLAVKLIKKYGDSKGESPKNRRYI